VSQLAVPIGLCTYLEVTGQLEAAWIWFAIVLGHCLRALLSTWVFHRGRWRTIALDAPTRTAR
jgi:Na+-driven multidrug efflux pump